MPVVCVASSSPVVCVCIPAAQSLTYDHSLDLDQSCLSLHSLVIGLCSVMSSLVITLCTAGAAPFFMSERAMKKLKGRKTKVATYMLDMNLVGDYWGWYGKRWYHHTGPISMW